MVKKVQDSLKAIALSVKPGGTIDAITIGGSLRTNGEDVVTYEVDDGGSVEELAIGGSIEALGAGSTKTRIRGNSRQGPSTPSA